MAEDINHIVASYDIADPRRLYRIAKLMENYGSRVLKSIFECNLNYPLYREMKHKAEEIIDPIEDSVRYYFLCGKCLKNCEHLGKGGNFSEDKEVIII